jgi:hypothetical protein
LCGFLVMANPILNICMQDCDGWETKDSEWNHCFLPLHLLLRLTLVHCVWW